MIRIGIDTETTGLNVWTGDRPFAVSMFDEYGKDYYWEWRVNPKTRKPIIKRKDKRQIKQICGSKKYDKDFFNLKFDKKMLHAIGIEVAKPFNEVTYMAKCVNNLEFNYKLKPLAKKYANIPDDDEKYLRQMVIKARRAAKKLGWKTHEDVEADYWTINTLYHLNRDLYDEKELDREACKLYAVRDAERTLYLGEIYRNAMDDYGCKNVYDFEMEVFNVTERMERRGVRVDTKKMSELKNTCERVRDRAHKLLVKSSGKKEFNPNSSDQVIKLLFGGEPLKLPVLKRNKPTKKYPKGSPKTDAENLFPHKNNKLVETLFKYRANEKALNTFFNKYAALGKEEEDGFSLTSTALDFISSFL